MPCCATRAWRAESDRRRVVLATRLSTAMRLRRGLIVLALGAPLPALALYKVVGPDGRVTYTDQVSTATRGGQVLPHTVDNGVWVFRLDAKPVRWEILAGTRVTAWTYNGVVAANVSVANNQYTSMYVSSPPRIEICHPWFSQDRSVKIYGIA